MKNEIKKLYRLFRKSGDSPKNSLWSAKTLHEFQTYENDYIDFVRIRAEYETENYFDFCDFEEYRDQFGQLITIEEQKKKVSEQIERDGVWCVFSEVNTSHDESNSQWEIADCIGMCIYGDPCDPFSNYYVTDLMHTANKMCREIFSRSLKVLPTKTKSMI